MLSGERFRVRYRLSGSEPEAYAKAKDICVEQTVEFPEELLPVNFIRDEVVGRIEAFTAGEGAFFADISYANETTAGEFTQLLNVIFGNISIKPGIRVESLTLPDSLLQAYKGPRFGRSGLRALLNVPSRPLLFTALKPMGLSAAELAELAYQLALGGIDIIKDDHGLTDQCFAPFEERVKRCAEAVAKANRETGQKSIFVANVTAPSHQVLARAQQAKAAGAGGIMAAPALIGLDTMRQLADDDSLSLPVVSHPAFQGSYVTSAENGISHAALFGQIARLAGADTSIYPNFGGRFSFSRAECESIAQATEAPMAHIKTIFPSPGGGMTLERVPELLAVYGRDVIFLMGGGLFKHSRDLVANCRHFRDMVEKF
jgi:ribulose-bisphosphate carboxylase large chain